MRTAVLIPTYQEAENITTILPRVRAVLPGATLVVIDDASPDGTADLAAAVGREIGPLEVLRRPAKLGLGPAYVAGYQWSIDHGYDVVVGMDADGSHDPAAIPDLLDAVDAGADLAMGSRWMPGGRIPDWPLHRRLLSRWGNRYAATVLGMPVRDSTGGFRAYRVSLLCRLGVETVRANGYGFQIEMAYRTVQAGGTIVERPIVFRDRVAGTSKMSPAIIVEALGLVSFWGVRDRLVRPRRQRPAG
jgi:dolichol-phosphate mannosyltransferase